MPDKTKPGKWGIWILVVAAGTLICCALPIVLVSLGLGAVVASLASHMPFLMTVSQHKVWMFAGTAMLLIVAGVVLYRPAKTCSADPERGQLCEKVRKWNICFFWVSVGIWCVGFITAYLLSCFCESAFNGV